MKIILATSNKHKIVEIQSILQGFTLCALDSVIEPFAIEENGTSFRENALIKARAVFEALRDEEAVVLSDDSGLCVDALGGEPGIYAARYSSQKTDAANRAKLMTELKKRGLEESGAHYVCAVALRSKWGNFSAEARMYGRVLCRELGEKGFGYDSLFVPLGLEKTLAQLDAAEKNRLSHRFKALNLAKIMLNVLKKVGK